MNSPDEDFWREWKLLVLDPAKFLTVMLSLTIWGCTATFVACVVEGPLVGRIFLGIIASSLIGTFWHFVHLPWMKNPLGRKRRDDGR